MWKPIAEYRPRKDPLHIIGWNEQWGVAEFMRHDDGWTIAAFNGQVKRSDPVMWQPMPPPPTF